MSLGQGKSTWRRRLKWLSLLTSVLLAASYLLSIVWHGRLILSKTDLTVTTRDSGDPEVRKIELEVLRQMYLCYTEIDLDPGSLSVYTIGEPDYEAFSNPDKPADRLISWAAYPHATIRDSPLTFISLWHAPMQPRMRLDRSTIFSIYLIPLWPFNLAAIAVTASLWWADRHYKSGCKTCGYSLTGLPTTSPCPECGQAPTTESLFQKPPP